MGKKIDGRILLDKTKIWCIVGRVKTERIPTLLLPTTDYAQMRTMSNRRLVSVLRSAVLSPEKVGRFSPRPPADYDSYKVEQEVGCISVRLLSGGCCVFCCRFEPAEEY